MKYTKIDLPKLVPSYEAVSLFGGTQTFPPSLVSTWLSFRQSLTTSFNSTCSQFPGPRRGQFSETPESPLLPPRDQFTPLRRKRNAFGILALTSFFPTCPRCTGFLYEFACGSMADFTAWRGARLPSMAFVFRPMGDPDKPPPPPHTPFHALNGGRLSVTEPKAMSAKLSSVGHSLLYDQIPFVPPKD